MNLLVYNIITCYSTDKKIAWKKTPFLNLTESYFLYEIICLIYFNLCMHLSTETNHSVENWNTKDTQIIIMYYYVGRAFKLKGVELFLSFSVRLTRPLYLNCKPPLPYPSNTDCCCPTFGFLFPCHLPSYFDFLFI